MTHSKIILTVFIVCFSALAPAKNVSTDSENKHEGKIAQACQANYKASTGNKADVCSCVARNFISVSKNWAQPAQKDLILEYTAKYFNNELTQKEMDADPYFLDDFIFDISTDCLENSNFILKK